MLSGEPKWWDSKVSHIRGEDGKVERLLCISRDITERRQSEDKRKQAEESLRKSEEQLSAIFSQAAVGLSEISLDGYVGCVNRCPPLPRSAFRLRCHPNWCLYRYPLIKDGEFVAGLAVHTAKPRAWTEEEVDLAEEVAERTWAAVERARAEAIVAADLDGIGTISPINCVITTIGTIIRITVSQSIITCITNDNVIA